MWEKLATQAKVGAQGKVTLAQFTDVAHREIVDAGDAGFDKNLRPTIKAIVDMCDTDGDGQVNPAEFKRWMKAVGVDERQADSAFRQIDTNSNGQLTVDELVTAVRDYHQGVNDIPLLGR